MASRMARLVISWKTMRFVLSTGRPNTSVRCHAMASPSRSSSEASQTVLLLARRLSSSTTFFLSPGISYTGLNPRSMWIPRSFFERSRMWPKLDLTMKSLPRNFSMVLALAGDSTMTKFSCMGFALYCFIFKCENLSSSLRFASDVRSFHAVVSASAASGRSRRCPSVQEKFHCSQLFPPRHHPDRLVLVSGSYLTRLYSSSKRIGASFSASSIPCSTQKSDV